MTDMLVNWWDGLSLGLRTAIITVRNFVILYAGMIAENQVQVISNGDLFPQEWGHAAIICVVFVTFGLCSHQVRMALERRSARERERLETMIYAESLIDQDVTDACRIAELALDAGPSSNLVSVLIGSPERLQALVTKTYQVFESRFAESNRMQDRINFEVTFMTKSLRDGKITIPAYANRNGRAPTSMQERGKNSEIYENTVTASVYRETHPKLQIIPDTHDATVRYAELYAGQRDRIRSSIVVPVLSPRNRLLGTLVVHCDKAGFFNEANRKFWDDLLSVFTRRIAIEKIKLEGIYGPLSNSTQLQLEAPSEMPF